MSKQQQHPITPPPELIEEWCEQLFGCPDKPEIVAYELARLAAQWGADQELEACLDQLSCWGPVEDVESLRNTRRPKPPSLVEEALNYVTRLAAGEPVSRHASELDTIRTALERLQELEGGQ